MAAFVLIHGAFTGGWIWGSTVRALSKLGHESLRPTLTGCGERSHLLRPEITLPMHVEDVAQLLFHEDLDRAVLVGHGYGAMIASAVAHRHGTKVAGVVHLDGVIPERGASFLDTAVRSGMRLPLRQDGTDWLVPPPPAESFGLTCREMARWLSVRLQPFPRSCLAAPYPYGSRDRELPGVYLRTTGLGDQPGKVQAAKAALLTMHVAELPTGPLPMVTNPGCLARVLDAAAAEMGVSGVGGPGPGRRTRPSKRCVHEKPGYDLCKK